MHVNENYTDQTQRGFLFFFERLARSHPLIYIFVRYLAYVFCIFEDEFQGIKHLGFKKEINLIDIGASDGIAIKYISKLIKINKVYIFEPHKPYNKYLKKLKFKKKIYNYGISNKNETIKIYTPIYKFFTKKFSLITYSYYNQQHLRKVLNQNFFLHKDFTIEKRNIYLKKLPVINSKIDLIKIDVNGYEFEIIKSLKSLILKNKPTIITEELSKIALIDKFLKKYDYVCCYYDYKRDKIKRFIPNKSNPLNFYFLPKHHFSSLKKA
ncbi:FkbM family methyltransferase [Pelagibacteraceae bacterium]|nr:FkbM family methyltransferase [Pelagibacteraceae bacterium]